MSATHCMNIHDKRSPFLRKGIPSFWATLIYLVENVRIYERIRE